MTWLRFAAKFYRKQASNCLLSQQSVANESSHHDTSLVVGYVRNFPKLCLKYLRMHEAQNIFCHSYKINDIHPTTSATDVKHRSIEIVLGWRTHLLGYFVRNRQGRSRVVCNYLTPFQPCQITAKKR